MLLRPIIAAAAVATLALAACSPGASNSASSAPSSSAAETNKLTVLTHDSFSLPDELLAQFEASSGMEVEYVTLDGGALVNQLILTKDSPLGDVVYGIDNTFATRAAEEGVLADYTSPALPDSAKDLAADKLTPIDFGDVCLNADTGWFAEKGIPVPTTLDDLLKPEYKDLTVVTDPTASATGTAFLLATIGEKGDDWVNYWQSLKENGVQIAAGWTEAYYTDFSGADGKGPRPIVLSYATSPAYTIEGDTSTTQALLNTCFRQVEYAGVINGAANEAGAQAFIDFLLTDEVQESIPGEMYMYPANTEIQLPQDWVKFAPLSTAPIEVPAAEISANRDQWLVQWSEAIG